MPQVSAINKRLMSTKDYVRKNKTFFAKRTQFPKESKERKFLYNNELRTTNYELRSKKRTQNEPNRTQNEPNFKKAKNDRNIYYNKGL